MSPEDLVKALSALPKNEHPELLVGHSTFDDAGVIKLTDELALVQTLDFFPPIVDDPIFFGRIAAANALSDVYAMGGQPNSCLSIVGWPKELPPELLGEILRGGQEKIDEAGCILAGGHTVTDSEIKYGLSVTGLIHPQKILTNAGACVGDVLVLTKPVGMGAISTGIKKGMVSKELQLRAMECMATLNKAAASAALAAGAKAATDITGFGLSGHATEMAQGSGVTIEFQLSKLPVFESALELVREGIFSGAAKRTRTFLADGLQVADGLDEALVTLCLDAETSGGLLVPVPEEAVDGFLRDLRKSGTPAADVVGRVLPRDGAALHLRS